MSTEDSKEDLLLTLQSAKDYIKQLERDPRVRQAVAAERSADALEGILKIISAAVDTYHGAR